MCSSDLPRIARWNLSRLAETLLPLIAESEGHAISLATEVLDAFPERYRQHWLAGLRAKLGLHDRGGSPGPGLDGMDIALGESWLDLLHAQQVDFTLAWRRLADAAEGLDAPLRALFAGQPGLERWLQRWRDRCAAEATDPKQRAAAMRRVNPWLIPRNHRVEAALDAASNEGDLGPFEQLLNALRRPYDEDPERSRFAEPAPDDFMAEFRTFCGT